MMMCARYADIHSLVPRRIFADTTHATSQVYRGSEIPGTCDGTATEITWKLFVSSADSRKAADKANVSALFESAPSRQLLFVTPWAVQVMRFMNGIANFSDFLKDLKGLQTHVETLGFGRLAP